MKLLLSLALVLHLSGLPAVAASPCAANTAVPGGECCIRHQTETGGDVIGYCGCQAPDETLAPPAVSVAPSSPFHSGLAPVLATTSASVVLSATLGPSGADCDPPRTGDSPPRLSGTGFRC